MNEHDQPPLTEDVPAGAEAGPSPAAATVGDTPDSTRPAAANADDGARSGLLGDTKEFTDRWEAIQAGFVDEPRRAVEDADALVAKVIDRMNQAFATQRSRLEARWSQGEQASTEDLRVALHHYRSFFNRLLSR